MAPWEPDPDWEAEGGAVDAEADADADADAVMSMDTVLKLRPETIALAWLGLTVVVLAEELSVDIDIGMDIDIDIGIDIEFESDIEEPLLLGGEDEPDPEEPLLPLVRTSSAKMSIWMSMKVITGPATIALLCLSTAWPFRAWSSDVIQIATAPLIPMGTLQSLSGREREKGMPPVSIWQWKPEVLLLRAGELNCKEVPTPIEPVLVTESEGLAGTPRSQPLMNEPAMARTSFGRRGMSNGWEMAEPPSKRFKTVWWRDSMVKMEAAAVRTRGSSMRCAAPR